MRTVQHILPHPGGGAEAFIDALEEIPGYTHERWPLSATRRPHAAGPSIAVRWPRIAAATRRADLVITHGDVSSILAVPMLRARPSLAFGHGLHLLRRVQGMRLAATRRALIAVAASSSRLMCSSQAELEELRAFIPSRYHDRLQIVYNTAPPAQPAPTREAARAEFRLADDAVVALYLAELEPRKDPLTAVAAAQAARAAGSPFVLLVVGDGSLRPEVDARAGDAVRSLGFRRDLPTLFAAADIFVMPSEREGQSIAVLQALRAGLAMVVSDGPGNPESVADAGVVFPFGDVAALSAAFESLARDSAERRRLGEAARDRYAERFAPERFRTDMEALFAAITAPAPPVAAPHV